MVTANTIDQRIVERAAAKRKLEKMVIHKGVDPAVCVNSDFLSALCWLGLLGWWKNNRDEISLCHLDSGMVDDVFSFVILMSGMDYISFLQISNIVNQQKKIVFV